VLAAVTPKVAAAAVAIVAFAGGGAVVWHASVAQQPAESVALADAANPSLAEDTSSRTASSESSTSSAFTDTGKLVRDAGLQTASLAQTALDSAAHPQPAAIAFEKDLRMAVSNAVGPDDASKLMTDEVLEQISDALAKAGIDSSTLDAKLLSGPPIALAIGVTEIDSPTLVLMKPRVLIGVRTHPAR
jgi:hypothetical protein